MIVRAGNPKVLARLAGACLLASIPLSTLVYSQETWGGVRVVVMDLTGAVIPEAHIELSGPNLPLTLPPGTT